VKNWLNNWKNRRNSFGIEHELRAQRPTPPEHLVKSISARVNRRRPIHVGMPARLGRVAVVVAVAGALLVGSSLAAGLGPAGGVHLSSVIHFSTHPFASSGPVGSANDEYVGAPTVTGFSPTSGLVGTTVAISGTNFGGTTDVTFNGTSASFSVNSATSITATVPTGATSGTISVSNPGGDATSTGTFTVIQTPVVSSFTPTFGPVNTVVYITGSNFTGTTLVKFGTTSQPNFNVDSDTQITTTVPAGAKTGKITLTNPAGSGLSSASFVVATESAPTVGTFAPTSGKVGASVAISGSHFTGATEVDFNGTPATFTVNSDAKITAKVPTAATTGPVTVVNGAGSDDSAADFTVIVAPAITSFTPTSGAAGKVVEIDGSGFSGTTAVKFGGVATTVGGFTVVSDSEIDATVPATAKTGPISVTNPAATATSTGVFTVATNAPKVTTFAPAFGAQGASVTITGTNLANTTNVKFGTTSASSFTVNSDTSVTAVVPNVPAVAGGTNVTVTVTTDVGAATSTTKFNVIEAPSVDTFSPASGLANAMVTINGSGFTGTGKTAGDFVEFNGIQTTFTVNSDSKITAKVPVGASTGPISVKNAAGTDASASDFVVPTAAPTIASFSPTSGLASHTPVAITGTDLAGATKVTFNGKAATLVTSDTATEIDVIVPAGATSGAIVVTTAKGTGSSLPSTFTVDATPKIGSFSPTQGAVGDSVVITGSGFAPVETGGFGARIDDTVTFPGAAPVAVNATDDNHITVNVPAGATTGKIAVANHYGDTSTSTTAFTIVHAPTIGSFTPASGLVGSMVTINGSGFTGTGKSTGDFVEFNGINSTFTVNSDTKITAKVPVGAATGPISVKNAAGTTAGGTDFVVPAGAPAISSFTPTSGLAARTSVTINGTNLAGANKVTFNGKPAAILSNTNTAIVTQVPLGATTGVISVTTGQLPAATTSALTPSKFTVDPTPKVTGFSVALGKAGDAVTITGSGFAPVEAGGAGTLDDDTVSFTGAAPVSVTATDDTHITVNVPVGARTGKITVGNQLGDTGTSTLVFTVIQTPSIASFSPGSGKVGALITINGLGFTATGKTAGDFVEFNGVQTTFTVNSDTKITAKVPVGATNGPISVKNEAGTATSLAAFIVPTGIPTIASLSPDNGPASAHAGTTVTITGANLRGASKVTFNGKTASSVSVIDNQTIVAVTPSTGATTGFVMVTTPAGTASSSPAKFTVNAPPKVTGLSVALGKAGDPVTITGTGFLAKEGGSTDNHVTVTFGTGSVATTATSDTSITVNVPNTATTGKITVANNFGETGTGTTVFTVIKTPAITSFSPGSGKPGSMVTINGSGFTGTGKTGGDFVEFGGTTTTFTVTGDTKITAKVPTTLAAGSYTISVKNAAGTAASASQFVVVVAAPTITSFTPSDGPASSQAQSSVVITGTNLAGATKVTVNGKVQTLIGADTDTEIDLTLAAGTTTGLISVTTPAGAADTHLLSPSKFTVDPAPKITSFTPSGGIGESVTITGSGFETKFNGAALDNLTSVSFNGTDATADITAVTDTTITVNVPDAATSGPITVENGHGESTTSAGVFTVVQPPSISSFSPASGAVGDPVTITGSHFSGATAVDFNGTPATTFHVDSDGQITVTVPAGATDGPITVTRPHGSGTSASSFDVTP
jgi:hypothetical protein